MARQAAPEVWEDCPACNGEGSVEEYEAVSKWSIDPPSAHVVICQACNGAGGSICEAYGDAPSPARSSTRQQQER